MLSILETEDRGHMLQRFRVLITSLDGPFAGDDLLDLFDSTNTCETLISLIAHPKDLVELRWRT